MPEYSPSRPLSEKTAWPSDRLILLGKSASWILLALSLAGTTFAWYLANGAVSSHARANFEFRTTEITNAIRDRIGAYVLALRGGAALFNASRTVTMTQWKDFAATMDLNTNYPGIQGLGYSPAIFPDTKEQHIAEMRSQGFPDYAIRPPGDREAYTPVIYLEPDNALNKKAFGFDTFSNDVRRAAIERARDTAKPTITGKITLVQEGTTNVQPGFIMFLAVYKSQEPPATVEERRLSIKGYVNAPFRMYNLMNGIIPDTQNDVAFEVFDGSEMADASLMYRSEALTSNREQIRPASFVSIERMEILGRPWTVRLSALEEFENAIDRRVPYFIACSGLIVSLLLFAVFRAFLRDRVNILLLEQARKHESELLRGILDNFPMPYILVDAKQRILKTNTRFIEMLELDVSIEGCNGKTLKEISCHDAEYIELIEKSISDGAVLQNAEVHTKSCKGKDKVMLVSISPLYDIDKVCIGGLCIYMDLTERRQMEIKLASVGKMEAIGQLAAGIAHEINTPTQYVGDGVTFLRDSFADISRVLTQVEHYAAQPDAVGEVAAQAMKELLHDVEAEFLQKEIPSTINRIFEGIERISTIVQAMRRFSHSSGDRMLTVDLENVVRTTVEISRNEWKYVSTMELDFSKDLPNVRCQQDEISQVLLNIIVNASHSVADVVKNKNELGKITIRTRKVDDMAEISISDTGSGIPEEVRDKVFNMFFTTKDVGKGTGQGLAIAYESVVNKHEGSLTFSTEVGVGTTFYVRIPIDGPKNSKNEL
ncbi:MAG: CHASE domain-containing protein [Desulfovibrio sp.]|nr:CHASE domain-containing protein [Desulfovibrio sp.]MBI4961325.1 CHASE domain-containing protein [Desulfovibrio sp.]